MKNEIRLPNFYQVYTDSSQTWLMLLFGETLDTLDSYTQSLDI